MKHNKLETARNNDQSCKVNWWQKGRARNTNTEGKTGMKATEGERYGQPTRQPAHTKQSTTQAFLKFETHDIQRKKVIQKSTQYSSTSKGSKI